MSSLHSLRFDGAAFATLGARAPQWVAGLLVVALGARAARLVADLAGGSRAALPATQTGAAPSLPPRLDLPGLIAANLFGSAASQGQQGPAPVTSMPLVLVGVMAADDPKRGIAILGPSGPAARVYLVGATLPGGARLHEVHSDRVLIDRGGSIEALLLPRQPSSVAPPPPPPPPVAAAGDRIQQFVQTNPGVISNVLRPQVVLVDGRQRGFRVYPGPNRQAFNKLGLRPGDLVTAINGTVLDDPTVANNIFGTLSTSPNAHVTVTRDGRQQDLVINVAQAVSEVERLGTDAGGQGQTDPTVPPP